VLKKRKVEIAEGRFLEKEEPIATSFDELVDAYLRWTRPNEEAGIPAQKRSWHGHDLYAIGQLRAHLGGKRLTAITPALEGRYRDRRRSTISQRNRSVSAAPVGREPACLKRRFNVACKHLSVLRGGVPPTNPVVTVGLEREHNARDRVLSAEEFQRLHDAAEPWLRPFLLVALPTGMWRGEIRSSHWDQIDLKTGAIRLKSSDTKTGEGRVIPLNQAF